jgi:hypothetical protein
VSPRRWSLPLLGLLLGLSACGPGGPSTPGLLLPPASATRAPQASPTGPATQPPEALSTATEAPTAAPSATASREPGLEASATPLVSAATATIEATSEGPCTDNLGFVADVTVPDGSEFLPGQPIDKQWRVRNTGNCEWGPDYRLVLVSGNALSGRGEIALYPARPDTEAILQMAMVAPQEPGPYSGRWQARDPAGKLFGDRIFITIQVVAPSPTPTETPSSTPSP